MDFNRKLKQKKNYLISKSLGAFSLWIIHFVSVDGKNAGAKGIRNCYHEWQSIWPIYYSGGLAYTKYSVNFDMF